jgi:hypothetical protein
MIPGHPRSECDALRMDAALHRIEALPGDGRFAVTFRRPDGSEQSVIVHLEAGADGSTVEVAEASLPAGWVRATPAFDALGAAVTAFAAARRDHAPAGLTLHDVDGGWDVSLGNVVLGDSGQPVCTAHGELTRDEGTGRYVCAECGAAAVVRGG